MKIPWKYCPLCKRVPNRYNSTWFDCFKCELFINIDQDRNITMVKWKAVDYNDDQFERILKLKAFL